MNFNFVKYVHALKWEFLQNLPMVLGFLLAARLRPDNLVGALLLLVVGIFLGIVMMHFTEPFLHRSKYTASWKDDLFNFGLFLVFGIPFLYYFSLKHSLLNWKADLILGVIIGALLAFAQALTWRGPKLRMVVHGIAMAVSFPILLIGIRFILNVPGWGNLIVLGVILTLVASAIITLVDYAEMFRASDKP